MWINSDVIEYYLEVPQQIDYLDQTYCNASLIVPGAQDHPYPLRFQCTVQTTQLIRIQLLPKETGAVQGWLTPYNTYSLRLYFNAHILANASAGPTNNFIFYGMAVPSTSLNLNYAIDVTTATISLNPYNRPDLNQVTFNTLSFADRRGRIDQGVQFYMLLTPNTAYSAYPIDKLVFALPK
jgi:hypothetical protein